MTTLLTLSRKLELVVVRAAGISVWQFLFPGLVIAGGIGIFSILAYNPAAAILKQYASEVETRIFLILAARRPHTGGRDILDFASARKTARRSSAPAVSWKGRPRSPQVNGFSLRSSGGLSRANRSTDRRYCAPDIGKCAMPRVIAIEGEPERFDRYLLPSGLEPDQLRRSFMPPESVPFWSLAREGPNRPVAPGSTQPSYQLRYESLLARPLLFVAMVLVAASVSLRFFRFGGVGPLVLGGGSAGGFSALRRYRADERDLGGFGSGWNDPAAWFPAVGGQFARRAGLALSGGWLMILRAGSRQERE